MISVYNIYNYIDITNEIEQIAYNAVINNDEQLIENICYYIDNPYDNLFETQLDNYLFELTQDQEDQIKQHVDQLVSGYRKKADKLISGQDTKFDTNIDSESRSKLIEKHNKGGDPKKPSEEAIKKGNEEYAKKYFKTFSHMGPIRNAVERIGKSKVVQSLANGINKGLNNRLGKAIKRKTSDIGMSLGKNLEHSGNKKINKALDDIRKYSTDMHKQAIDYQENKDKPFFKTKSIIKNIAKNTFYRGLLPSVATAPFTMGLGGVFQAPLSLPARLAQEFKDPVNRLEGINDYSRKKLIKGSRRVNLGQTLYNKFKQIKERNL